MTSFSAEYIEICKQLPQHEFEVGDWYYFHRDSFPKPKMVENLERLEFVYDGLKRAGTWLPHSIQSWMEMKEWDPNWYVIHSHGTTLWTIYEYWEKNPKVIVYDYDPLMACAKAFRKVNK